jgi:phytoene dehydrogenase-like protein
MSALVIGGGFAGLAAAMALRARGERVTLLEQHAEVGGKARAMRAAQAVVDLGPTLLVDPGPLRTVLALAGATRDEVALERLDPVALVTLPDGAELRWQADAAATTREMRRLGPEAGADWARFLEVGARAARLAGRFLECGDVAGPRDLWRFVAAGRVSMRDLAPFVRHASLAALLEAMIHTPAVRRLLAHFARFLGLDAPSAPAVALVIPYLLATSGAWYPRGGIAGLARTLGRLAERRGVDVLTGAPVDRLEVRADGVVALAAGRRLSAAHCVSAVDVATTARWLGPDTLVRVAGRLTPAMSAVVGWWVVQGRPRVRVHHAFHFDEEGEPLYVATPTVTDASLAPAGVEIVYALVHVPAGTLPAPGLGAVLRRRVEAYGQWPSGRVLAEGVAGGGASCYGYRIGPGLFRAFRPSQRVPGLPLALAGDSVFPGPGVANVLSSGLRAASLVGRTSQAAWA